MNDTTARTTALTMLKDGNPPGQITAATGLTTGELAALAEAEGLTREHATQTMKEYLQALTWGERHDTKRIQNLATRARTALDELVQARASEEQAAAAAAEVAKLKQQLADAEARLRQAKGKPATPSSSQRRTPATGGTMPHDKAERARIREWARAQGYKVADRGLIPQQIITAFNARHSAAPQQTA
jgi:seryl-tRNA synthetase